MLRQCRPVVFLAAVVSFALILSVAGGRACLAEETADDEATQKGIAERFAIVLEKNPRRGTAFEKVYGYHLERGSLDELLKKYLARAKGAAGSDGAAAWMIVGLVESQRGRDAEAIRAFSTAETLDSKNSMASFLLGQSLMLFGQSKEAAEALERAVERKPAPADLLVVFQSLGRVYQRAQKSDKALDVWNRLEQQFPNDLQVQEQIATTLLEENELAAALPRFENLGRVTRDKYRQSLFQVEAAEIKARLGKSDEALDDFEKLLKQLNPDHWLYHDVRRRIESMYLKTDNQAGLIAYYEAWLEKNPEDLDVPSRLSRLLASVGRADDARDWLRRGLKQAPSNKELRQALINQLVIGHKWHEAAEQYQELNQRDPNNPDVLREWGRAVLKDKSLGEEQRRQEAVAIWRKLLTARPKDAHAASQVADLFRQAGVTDEAIDLYRRAIELAPDSEQYREYLGEYLFSLKRTDQALSVWRDMATDPRRTAPNLARLAEILATHDQLSEAISTNAEACRLDPKDFNIQVKQADLLFRAEKYDEDLEQLSRIQKIAADDEEREAWLRRELQTLKKLKRLAIRIADVRQELTGNPEGSWEKWFWLARAEEANDQPRSAIQAITKAVSLKPDSIPILTVAARLNESQQKLGAAVDLYLKLAAINRRYRTEYLKRIVILEEKRGNRISALQFGRDLLEASPGNPEAVDFFAGLCFRQGRYDEGLRTLRRSLRTNPGDLATLLKLSSVLLESNQTTEAVELLWRAFERSHNLSDRLTVVQHLADAYAKSGDLKKLYTRLEREGHEPAQRREMTLCLAQAYERGGDPPKARSALEALLSQEPRDTVVLTHLRDLAGRQLDFESAIEFQRQLWKVTGHHQDKEQLAQLLLNGEHADEAIELLTDEDGSKELNAGVLQLVDGLKEHGRRTEALARVRYLRKTFPENWELLYREGELHVGTSPTKARACFESLLKLDLSDDESSLLGTPQISPSESLNTETPLPVVERFAEMRDIRRLQYFRVPANAVRPNVVRTVNGTRIATPNSSFSWFPHDYGLARLAAFSWLEELGSRQAGINGGGAAMHRESEPAQPRRQFIDQIYLQQLSNNTEEAIASTRALIHQSDDDVEAKVLYLVLLGERSKVHVELSSPIKVPAEPVPPSKLPALSAERLDEALQIYHQVASRPDLVPLNISLMSVVKRELVTAGREQIARQLLAEAATKVASPIELSALLSEERKSVDYDITLTLLDRMLEMPNHVATGRAAKRRNATAPGSPTAELPEQLVQHVLPQLQRLDRTDDMLVVWNRFLRVSARDGVRKRIGMVPLFPSSTQVSIESDAMPDTFPALALSRNTVLILGVIRRQYQKEKRGDELRASLEKDSLLPDQTPEERLLRRHALAYLMWSSNEREAAIGIIADAAKGLPSRQDLRLKLARQFELQDQPARALTMLDTIEPAMTTDRCELEKMALRLAIDAKQPDRASLAAERISNSSNDSEEVVALARQLLRSGLPQGAETLLNRIGKTRSLELSEQRMLMDVQLALRKMPEATVTAHALLDQLDLDETKPVMNLNQLKPVMNVSNKATRQSTFKYAKENSSELRMHCFKVLHQTGALAKMIDAAEQTLHASPKSEDVIGLLIKYHIAAGNRTRFNELQTQRKNLRPDAPVHKYEQVFKFLSDGRTEDALEELRLLLGRDPDYVASRVTDTLREYDGKPQLASYFELLGQLEWNSDSRLSALAQIIQQMRNHPSTVEIADQVFAKVWTANPDHRIELLQRFPGEHWWELALARDGMTSGLFPRNLQRNKNRWRLFGCVIGSPQESQLVTVWNRLLSTAASSATLDALAMEVARGVSEWPDWFEGEVLLATIELRRGRIEAGRDALDRQFPKLLPRLKTRYLIAWEIAQELARHPDSLDVAAKYFAAAIHRGGQANWMTASSPCGAMIDAYVLHHRPADARRVLLQNVPENLRFQPDSILNPPASEIAEVLSIGNRLRSLDDPIDAIEVFQAALQRLGSDPNAELILGLAATIGELKPDSLARYLDDFDGKCQQLHLYPVVSHPETGEGRLQTHWDAILDVVAADATLTKRTVAGLERLAADPSNAGVALIFSARLWLAAKDRDKAAAAVDQLVRLLDEQQDKENSSTEHKAPRPRAAALQKLSLWLVARECLREPSLTSLGEKLGERTLQTGRVDSTAHLKTAILNEWIAKTIEVGDTAKVERLKAELAKVQSPWR